MVNLRVKVLIWVFCHYITLKNSHQYNASEWVNPVTVCPLPWPTFQISHDLINEPEEYCHDKCKKKCDGRGFYLDENANQVVCYSKKTTSHMIDGISDKSVMCECGGQYEKYGDFENCFPEMKMSLNDCTNRLRVNNCKKFCHSVDIYWSDAVENVPPYIIRCHRGQVKSFPLKGKCDFTQPLDGETFRCYCGIQQPHRRRKPIPQTSAEITKKNKEIEGFARCDRPRISSVFAPFEDIKVCDRVCHHRNCQGKAFRHKNDLHCFSNDEVRTIMKTTNPNPLLCECGILTKVDDPTSFASCEDRAYSWTMNIVEQKTECELKCFGIKAFTYQHGDTTILIKCAFESENAMPVVPLEGKCKDKLYRDKKTGRNYRNCYCGLSDEKLRELVAKSEIEDVRDAASLLYNIATNALASTNNTSLDCNKTMSQKPKMNLKRPPFHSGKSRSLSEVMESTSQTSVPKGKSQSSHMSALGRANKNKAESALNNDRTQSDSHASSRGKGIALVRDFGHSVSTETESESEKQEIMRSDPATSTSLSGARSSSDSSYKPSKDSVNSEASDSMEINNKSKKSKKDGTQTWLTDWAELPPDIPSTSKNQPRRPPLVIPSISSLPPPRRPTQVIPSISDNSHHKNGSHPSTSNNPHQKTCSDNPSTSNYPHQKTGCDIPSTSYNRHQKTGCDIPSTLNHPHQKTGYDIPSTSYNPHQKTGCDIPSTSYNPHQKTGCDIPSTSNNPHQGPATDIPVTSEDPPAEKPTSKKTNRRRVVEQKSMPENTTRKKPKSKDKSKPKNASASDLPKGKSNSKEQPTAVQLIEEPTTSDELLMRRKHGPRVKLPPGYKMHGKEFWTVDLTLDEPKKKKVTRYRPPKYALKVIPSSKNNPIIVSDSPRNQRRNKIMPEGVELIPVDDAENTPSRRKKRPHDSSGANPSRVATIPSTGVISLDEDEQPPSSLHGKQPLNENVSSAKKKQQTTRKSSADNSSSKSGTNKSTRNDNRCNSGSSHSKQKSSSPSSRNDNDKDWLSLAL